MKTPIFETMSSQNYFPDNNNNVKTAKIVKLKLLSDRDTYCSSHKTSLELLESRIALLEGNLLAARDNAEVMQHRERLAAIRTKEAIDLW